MRRIALIIIMVIISVTSARAEVFDIPANGTWVKVQDGEVTQWSAIPATHPKTRIDLVSYVEGGNRTTYYLIRSACSDGTVASHVIGVGNQLGVGRDCDGSITPETAAVLNEVQKLPAQAAALLNK